MDNDHQPTSIGRVLRASTRGFDFGTRSNVIDERHSFGAFVKVPVAGEQVTCVAVGLIYAIRIVDDPLVRELVMAPNVDNSALLDQRKNRLVPVETQVLNVGYAQDGVIIHSMPPRPPLSLTEVELMAPEEVLAFVHKLDYFRLVLGAGEVPSDDLLAASCQYAAAFQASDAARYDYLVGCGRQVARLLTGDLRRLAHLMSLLKPL